MTFMTNDIHDSVSFFSMTKMDVLENHAHLFFVYDSLYAKVFLLYVKKNR